MLSEEVMKALKVLDFKDVPLMKELCVRFLQLCIKCHPDKGGSDDKFKELTEAIEIVSKYIEENKEINAKDEEESLVRREFRECNFIKVNKVSITVKYPSKYASKYDEILFKNFGEPIDRTSSGNGKHVLPHTLRKNSKCKKSQVCT